MQTPERAYTLAVCQLKHERAELLAALKRLVADFDAIGEDEQVPEAINVNEHWDAARAAIAKVKG